MTILAQQAFKGCVLPGIPSTESALCRLCRWVRLHDEVNRPRSILCYIL